MDRYGKNMKQFLTFLAVFVCVSTAFAAGFWYYLGPVEGTPQTVFTVPQDTTGFDVPKELSRQHLIKNETAFRWLYGVLTAGKSVTSGGYRLDGSLTAWGVSRKISGIPDYAWVKIREGLRREQVGIVLREKLGWTTAQEETWNTLYPQDSEYYEGIYFPDTYLLPRDETPKQIAERFINHFNEKFAPYADEFLAQNVQWTTAITIASLIQREAGGTEDMPIISGVIWNRLDEGMRLQVDATIQYALGKGPDSWWPIIKGSDTRLTESAYNSYLHDGLPPTPIANPGLAAIEAAAHPADTDCLYYLHDRNRQIHCSVTYEEHVENIKEYLQ